MQELRGARGTRLGQRTEVIMVRARLATRLSASETQTARSSSCPHLPAQLSSSADKTAQTPSRSEKVMHTRTLQQKTTQIDIGEQSFAGEVQDNGGWGGITQPAQ